MFGALSLNFNLQGRSGQQDAVGNCHGSSSSLYHGASQEFLLLLLHTHSTKTL